MALFDVFREPEWQRIGLTLLHASWQGAIVAAAVALVVPLARVSRGAARYRLFVVALLVMALCPAATFGLLSAAPTATTPASPLSPTSTASPPTPAPAPVTDLATFTAVEAAAPVAGETAGRDARSIVGAGRTAAFDIVTPLLPYAVLGWLAGAAGLGLRLLLGVWGLHRWRRAATPLPSSRRGSLDHLGRRLGFATLPPVLTSPRIRTPMAFGLLRPVVLLPLSLVTSLPAAALEAIIAHELAHLRRLDRWVLLGQRLVEILLFFHPAVWWISRQIDAQRELCCDDLAVRATGRRIRYAEALVAVARLDGPDPGMALTMAGHRRALLERVAHLLGVHLPERHRAWPSGLVALLAVAVGVLLSTSVPGRADVPPDDARRRLEVRLVDLETSTPLAGARLKVRIDRARIETTTDERGAHVIELPEGRVDLVRINVESPGHVAAQKSWRREDGGLERLPAVFTLALPRGVSIGGTMVDENGVPVEGVIVHTNVHPTESFANAMLWYHASRTDAAGRWKTEAIFPIDARRIGVGWSHDDFLSHDGDPEVRISYESYTDATQPSIEQLYAHSARVTMARGVTVRGRVLAEHDRPAAGITIGRARPQMGSAGAAMPVTTTDERGRFRFQAERGQLFVVAHPDGHAPAWQSIDVGPNLEPITLRLEPGATVSFRVVDTDGKPLRGASVFVDATRGPPMLTRPLWTDESGRCAWSGAPPEPLSYSIGMAGYMSRRGVPIAPRGPEYVIEMFPELQVRGHVTDAASGAPVTGYQLIPGTRFRRADERVHWARRDARPFEGAYAWTFDDVHDGHAIRIEAEGYEPAQSRLFASHEGTVRFDFALVRGSGPSGVVVGADGTPRTGARVVLCQSWQWPIENGDVSTHDRQDFVWVETDARGGFRFPKQDEPFALAVLHDEGYAVVDGADLKEDAPIRLQRWSRVEGVYRIGGEPAAGVELHLDRFHDHLDRSPGFKFGGTVTTDEHGRFVFERVAEGLGQVRHFIAQTHRLSGTARKAPFEVGRGETATLTMGGRGRPVVGHVELSEGAGPSVQLSFGVNRLDPVEAKVPYPEGWGEWESARRGAWLRKEWNESGQSLAWHERRFRDPRGYSFQIGDDGSFRIDDVLPGTYELQVEIKHFPVDDHGQFGRTAATVTAEVVVPEVPGGWSDEPLDTGRHRLTVHNVPITPHLPASFEARTLDGEPIDLDDYRGRYLLLDFWATWCGPCRRQTPYLKEVHERFGSDERFAMIGLSLDPDAAPLRAYVRDEGLAWTQVHLGEWSKTEVPASYGVIGIPAILLIGPDGRVMASGLRDETIATAVETALKGR